MREPMNSDSPSSFGWLGRHPRSLWSLVLAFHLLLAFPFIKTHRDIPDEDAYQSLARNLVDHHGYFLDAPSFHQLARSPNTYYAPAWPMVLAGGYAVARGPVGFWIVSGIIWCVSLSLIWRLGVSLGWTTAGLWLIIAWFSVNPFFLYYHLHLMTETLAIAVGTAILVCGVRFVKQPSLRLACVLGLLSGAGHLTRTALLLPVMAIWGVALFTFPFRKSALCLIACLVAHLAVVGPWLVRMHSVQAGLGATEVKLGHNLFLYNYPGVDNPYELRAGERIDFPPGLEQMTPAGRDALLTRYAITGIMQHPRKYLRNCLRRAFYFFSPVPNFYASSLATKAGTACSTLVSLILPWAIIAWLLTKRMSITRGEAVLLISILLWYTFHILMHASIRQRLPSDLWVAMLAVSLWQRFRNSHRSVVGAAVRVSL